ncbi:MAG: hypothetical protein IKP42_02900 [Ruminococcus sp.]|nr:hypothetical protein [Ruminococcus sp.]
MKMKRLLASAMSAVCVLGTGALPAANVMTSNAADPWLDVTLQSDKRTVKPGESFDVVVRVANVCGQDIDLGGMQFKVNIPANKDLQLTGITTTDGRGSCGNPDTGETIVSFTDSSYVSGRTLAAGTDLIAATYSFKVPDNAQNGTSYDLSGDWGFSYACDKDGNEVTLELAFANAMVNVGGGVAPENKNMAFEVFPSTVSAAPGEEFEVTIKAGGADIAEMTGFQMRLNMPEGIECMGFNCGPTKGGAEIIPNRETAELASAKQDGSSLGVLQGDTIASITFKVPENYLPGVYSFSIADAWVSDRDGAELVPQTSSSYKLNVTGSKAGKLGDANLDGAVDAKDASKVLVEYSLLSTGKPETFNEQQKLNGDVNFDGKIDSKDASRILAYYSYLSTGGEMIMEDWVKEN